MSRLLTFEVLLLFIDEIRLDSTRSHALRAGTELLSEASRRGLAVWGDSTEFSHKMIELRDIGLIEWHRPDFISEYDLINCRDFRLTAEGLRQARELRELPAQLFVEPELMAALGENGWLSVEEELRAGDNQLKVGHLSDAVSEYYSAVESALKYRLEEADQRIGSLALKGLVREAVGLKILPNNYAELFGYLNSIRSPRKHGRGPQPDPVEVGVWEVLLLANHARALIAYLLQSH